MEAHLMPIRVALITFPLVAIFFTLPFVIYQYRKFAYVNKFKALILYSFLLYLMVAYYLVILPLPAERDILSMQRPGTVHYNLVPFRSFKSIIDESNVVLGVPATYRLLFTERDFLQVVFNAILLTPLGIYLRYYFKRNLKQTSNRPQTDLNLIFFSVPVF